MTSDWRKVHQELDGVKRVKPKSSGKHKRRNEEYAEVLSAKSPKRGKMEA